MQQSFEQLHNQLFEWWRKHGRVLPWRKKQILSEKLQKEVTHPDQLREKEFHSYFASSIKRDPYRVVVSELMLQQTQVDRVLPKYEAWMAKWPKIEDLAQASLAEVLIFWQGLGYNRRARFLWLLAQEIANTRKGVWPTTELELLSLPGIGKYTARAVMSFAFGQQVGVVDTNVKRILLRVLKHENEKNLSEKAFFALADLILPEQQADPWNQALMDFGALICTARSPKCERCPLQNICIVNLDAQKHGYLNYAQLLQQEQKASGPKSSQKKNVAFKDTDRFFRGRIVDELRSAPTSLMKLQKTLQENYGLLDTRRFEKLLASLEKEGILRRSGDQVSLG